MTFIKERSEREFPKFLFRLLPKRNENKEKEILDITRQQLSVEINIRSPEIVSAKGNPLLIYSSATLDSSVDVIGIFDKATHKLFIVQIASQRKSIEEYADKSGTSCEIISVMLDPNTEAEGLYPQKYQLTKIARRTATVPFRNGSKDSKVAERIALNSTDLSWQSIGSEIIALADLTDRIGKDN